MADSRKKVLYLITKGNFGGAQRYVHDLASNLPSDQWNPVVAFGEGDELGRRLDAKGIRAIRISELGRDVNILKEFKSFFALLRLIQDEEPHILHLNSSKIGVMGAVAGRFAKVPKIVFTAHGWASNEDRNIVARLLFKALHWLTLVLCDVTIAVSHGTKDDMAGLPFTQGKMCVVYNGIEPAILESKSTVRTLLAPAVHEAVWIGTASELHRNKGIDYALRAFAPLTSKYSHVAFIVMGAGEERKGLERLADELGIRSKVHFLGNIPDAGSLLKAFDIFTLTSRTEAFPYAILEAGRAETAVVASEVGGIPELVTNKTSGMLAKPGDVRAITDALTYLIEHPEKRSRYGKELGKRVARRFTVDRMVADTVKVYEKR